MVLESIIKSGQSFDPATCNRMFNIGMTDYSASCIYPKLIPILEHQAPNIKINTVASTQMYSTKPFEKDEYDIGIGRMSPLPSYIQKKLLIKEGCVCVLNAQHPLAKKKEITLSEYSSFKHVSHRTDIPDNPNLVAMAIEESGGKVDAILYVPYIDSLFRLLEKSNGYIATVLKSAAQLSIGKYNLVIKPFPIKSPEYEWYIAWHP